MPDAPSSPIRVLVADAHLEVRRLYEYLLGRAEDLRLLGSVASAADLVDAARALRPEVALVDVHLPHLRPEVLQRLRDEGCAVVLVGDRLDPGSAEIDGSEVDLLVDRASGIDASVEALRSVRAG